MTETEHHATDPKALPKALFKVCSPQRSIPVPSVVIKYLAFPADHKSLFGLFLVGPYGPPVPGWVFELWKTPLVSATKPQKVVTDIFQSSSGLLSCYIPSETSVLQSLLQNQLKILPVDSKLFTRTDCRFHRSVMLRVMIEVKNKLGYLKLTK